MINVKEIIELSIPERILLVETIWDSIEADSSSNVVPFTDEQISEITRRLGAHERGEAKTYMLEEVLSYAREK
jgi:putative addiction module component (TIGR02574 family)